MKHLSQKMFLLLVAVVLAIGNASAAGLSGSVAVNQTSDTAANAKINAVNMARRQILSDVLSPYANKESLNNLIKETSSDDLMNLISSSSVSNEQISANGYSAKITMNVDNEAVKKWLDSNEVQNWVPLTESDERFTVVMVISNGVSDWAELKRIAREDNVEIETQSIVGKQIVAKMPLHYRTKFTAAAKSSGWHFSDNAGVLHIWK